MNNDDKEFFSRIKKGADSKHFIMLSRRKVPSVPPLHLQDVKDPNVMKMIDKRMSYWDKIREDFRREFGFTPVELVVFPIRQFSMTMWTTGVPFTTAATLSWNEEPTIDPIPEDAVKKNCAGYSVILGTRKHQYLKEEVSRRYVIDFLKSDKHNNKVREKFIKPLLGKDMILFFYIVMNKMASCVGKAKCSWTEKPGA